MSQINILVDDETRKTIEAMAEREHRKLTQMGRVLLMEAIAARTQASGEGLGTEEGGGGKAVATDHPATPES